MQFNDNKEESSNKKMTLTQIIQETADIESLLVENGGEITSEISERLNQINILLPQKLEGYSIMIARLEAIELHYQLEEQRMQKAKRSIQKLAEFMKNRIKFLMMDLEMTSLPGETCQYILKRSRDRLVIDETKEKPPGFTKIDIIQTLDKEAIRAHIENGGYVDCARLEPSYALVKVAKKGF